MFDSPEPNRASYLGGTDVAAIIGASPWKTPMDVWRLKTGKAQPAPMTERMEWGLALEPIVIDQYARRFGMQTMPAQFRALADCQFIGGHADGLAWPAHLTGEGLPPATAENPNGVRLLEVKCVNSYSRKIWATGVPFDYQCQAQLYLALHELKLCTFVVLFGGCELQTYDVEADPILQHQLLTAARTFWTRFVLADVPPPMLGLPITGEPQQQAQEVPEGSREADEQCRADLADLVRLRESIDALETDEQEVLCRLKEFSTGAITVSSKPVAGWATRSRKEQVLEAKTWQQFNVQSTKKIAAALLATEKNDDGS